MPDDLALFGHNLFGDLVRPKASGVIAERFTFPPFTVLDARQGAWQDRKQAWAAVGIAGEVGRADNLLGYSETMSIDKDTSIFDPVICELVYRWFTPEGGQVLDPFAGGSVRGIIAGALGRPYFGCDLRPEQIEANRAQALAIDPAIAPVWICGDSRETMVTAPLADLLFTCPPYGDLERYSESEADLSTLSWTGFTIAYRLILTRAAARLRDHRFAAIVVGNFRDKSTGLYRDLVAETVAAMAAAGLGYYKEGSAGLNSPRAGAGRTGGARNIHPTVKPVALMRWLIRLVTPPGGLVLDCFAGSGTTGMAAALEQRRFLGIEKEPAYAEIARRRIASAVPLFGESEEPAREAAPVEEQRSLYD